MTTTHWSCWRDNTACRHMTPRTSKSHCGADCCLRRWTLGSGRPAAPERARASFYRTATGVEVDLTLELPGDRLWAIEIKRGLAPRVERGLRVALADLQPERAFIVYGGEERYPAGAGVEVIGLTALAEELSRLA